MSIDWTTIIATALESLIPLVMTVLFYLALRWLKSRGATSDQIQLATEAWKIFQSCVLSVNQTFVDVLKEQGAFDEHAQELAVLSARNSLSYLFLRK